MSAVRVCTGSHPEGGQEAADRDLDLRDEIQRIALEFPCYGRDRGLRSELRRRGWDREPQAGGPDHARG